MKLYYTDEKGERRLIVEADDLKTIVAYAQDDAEKKFIHIKGITQMCTGPEIYKFIGSNDKGINSYTIEE